MHRFQGLLLEVEVAEYRRLNTWLLDYRQSQCPPGSVVLVHHPRFRGYGIVAHGCDGSPDYLPVLLESGNVWFYELETVVMRERMVSRWPRWIRTLQLRRKLSQVSKEGRSDA